MSKNKPTGRAFVQLGLYEPIVEDSRPSRDGEIIPLDFKTHAVRMILIRGQPWWVLADVARVLEYRDAANAGRILKEKHKGTHSVSTLGGEQKLLLVNEPGLYRLMLRSEKKEAEEFQDWITEEVLPSIRRTGSYTFLPTRARKLQRKLKCDPATAQARLDQIDHNRTQNRRLADEGASRRTIAEWHNAGYECCFGDGVTAATLREELGIPESATPLDHMTLVPLSINLLAKAIALKLIEDASEPLRPHEKPKLLRSVGRALAEDSLRKLGPDYRPIVRDDDERGRIIDVARVPLSLN